MIEPTTPGPSKDAPGQVPLNLPDRQTAGIQADHPIVEPDPPGLTLADDLRLKRPRAHSPPSSSTPPTPASAGNTRSTAGPSQRGSAGPQPSTPSLRETKSRTLRDTLLRQLPLQEGRMVAFHPPSTGKGADGTSPEDTTWIMARIVKFFNQDKHRYVRRLWAFKSIA